MSRAKSSKSRTFAAVCAADLELQEMDFDKWGADLFDDADEAVIRKYIEDEAESVKAKKESDLAELQGEEGKMQEVIDGLEAEAASLEERATAAAEKQAAAQEEMAKLNEEINTNKGNDSMKQKEVMGLKELSQDMSELRNKWVKDADKKNMDAVNKALATDANPIHIFIMDSLATFFAGEATTYADTKDIYFADAAIFGQQIRKVKPEKLDKQLCQQMAYRVNCDAEKEAGDVQKAMTDKMEAEKNLCFYVHYKLLFKLTQMSVSIRKMNGLVKSLNVTSDRNKALDVKVTTWKTISDNLAFGTML